MFMILLEGVDKITKESKAAAHQFGRQMEYGMIKGAGYLQAKAQKITPWKSGTLRRSARTVNVGGEGFDADIVVHFGVGASYAIFVHENTRAHHKKGTQAKFLESPARNYRKQILQIIRDTAVRGF